MWPFISSPLSFDTYDYQLANVSREPNNGETYFRIQLDQGSSLFFATWKIKTVVDIFSQIGGLTTSILGIIGFILMTFQMFSFDSVLIS